MLIPELKNKVVSTQNEKYNGVGFSSKYIHDKTMKSGKEKNSYSKSSFWKNKSEDEIRDIVSKMNKRYVYNNITFDSSWELAFYIYNIDNGKEIKRENKIIKYIENNKEHKYIIDFTVENTNYEIKSNYLLSKISKEKINCILENCCLITNKEIKFYIDYIKNKYGKNYLNKFRNW